MLSKSSGNGWHIKLWLRETRRFLTSSARGGSEARQEGASHRSSSFKLACASHLGGPHRQLYLRRESINRRFHRIFLVVRKLFQLCLLQHYTGPVMFTILSIFITLADSRNLELGDQPCKALSRFVPSAMSYVLGSALTFTPLTMARPQPGALPSH